ncbi:MAG: CPBP family intramembrane metalloprotease, partial [Actinomycetota bacterium]|nr:CPBP family intramembrane metalloprotease [Actinomycetota bacterium]
PPERPQGAVPRTPVASGFGWRPVSAWAALLSGFAITIFVGAIVAVVASAAGAKTDHLPPGVNIALTYFQDVALVGVALLFARMTARPRARDFGLRRTPLAPAVGTLLVVWAAFFSVSAAWIGALGIHDKDRLPDELGVDSSTAALVLVLLLVVVAAPIAEEFFFRGYFFTALRPWGLWPAAIVTGLVFGAIHGLSSPIGFLVPLAVLGIGLCILYWRTGSLYPCIALHALNNSVAFGASQHWTWQIPLTMIGAVAVALATAVLIARGLERRRGTPLPLPAS